MATRPKLSADKLRSLLNYDPETGIFTRRLSTAPSVQIGDISGCLRRDGYICINVNGKLYLAHRLAWLYVYGEWPSQDTDHVNGRRGDNRISNLRAATRSQNMANTAHLKNNASGFKGVCWCKTTNRWRARIRKDYKTISLGRYDSPQEAHAAYIVAAKKLYGEFLRAQ